MLARICGNFLRAIVNKNPVSTSYSIFDVNLTRTLHPSRNLYVTPINLNTADPCASKDVYKMSPLCPKKGFLYRGDGKTSLKCKSKSDSVKEKPKPEQKSDKKKPEADKADEKCAKDNKEGSCAKKDDCPKPPKPTKATKEATEMKAKVKTATDCPKKEKKEKKEDKKCLDKKNEPAKESCSVFPWPFNLLDKKRKKSAPKSKGKGKTKMTAISNDLSLLPYPPNVIRSLAYPSPQQLANFVRNFSISATYRFGPPVCPRAVKPCVLAALPKETESMMMRLRAVARANRKVQPENCIVVRTGDPCLNPATGWQTLDANSLMRSPEAMEKNPPRKNFERQPLVPRRLRK